MRINVVTPWYPDYTHAYSGVFVEKQVRALQSAGHLVHVDVPQIFPAPPGPVPSRISRSMEAAASSDPSSLFLIEDGVTYIPSPVPTGSGFHGRADSFAAGVELRRRVLPVAADLTHAHLGVPTGHAMLKLGDVPLVVTEHQSQLRRLLSDPNIARLYAATLEKADAFICVSRVLEIALTDAFGKTSTEKVEIVPNVVDLTEIPFVERPTPDMSNWLYVGALFQHKGVQTLLRSFYSYVTRIDPDASLTIIGKGPLRSWVERFVARRKIADRTLLMGQQPHAEIGKHLIQADCYVHLSPFETFGISSLEAIGAGTPVVSLRNGGAETTWGEIEEKVGVLLPSDSRPDEIADAVDSLRRRGPELDMRTGRDLIEERFSPDEVARRLGHIYERVLN